MKKLLTDILPSKIIYFLTFVFTLFLLVLSLRFFARGGTFRALVLIIENRNVVFSIVKIAVCLALLLMLLKIVTGVKPGNGDGPSVCVTRLVVILCGCVMFALGILRIADNTCGPVWDQATVWNTAVSMLQGAAPESDYYDINPHQKAMAAAMAVFIRLTGCTDPQGWRFLNLTAVIAIYSALVMLSYKLWNDRRIMVLTAALTMLFTPLVWFIPYIYGTLAAPAFYLWGTYFLLRFLDRHRFFDAIVCALLLALAVCLYRSAAIMCIAAEIVLLLGTFAAKTRKDVLMNLGLAALIVLTASGSVGGGGKLFDHLTGTSFAGGAPASSYVLMGITADEESHAHKGTGSYDGTNRNTFIVFHYDTEAADRYCRNEICKVMGEYCSGERSLSFFTDKTMRQWLDGWFDSITSTSNTVEPDETLTEIFLRSRAADIADECRTVYIDVIYLGTVLFALSGLFTKFEVCKKCTGSKQAMQNVILALFFVGGFIFQLFWEQNPRYCMPFFIALIPCAAKGINELRDFLTILR